ncbi:MAG: acyl carrier protein [Rhizobiaceae bacterium]|nr:acyl carrier protein [Rhizobiaceae bacterium]
MTATIRNAVRTFMIENFLFGDAASMPANGESLLDSGLMDSTGVLELVAYLEDQFAITLADTDIVPANLDSVDRIAAFVELRARRAAA